MLICIIAFHGADAMAPMSIVSIAQKDMRMSWLKRVFRSAPSSITAVL